MREFLSTWLGGAVVALALSGCVPTAQDSSGSRHEDRQAHGNGTDGAARSKDALYPTKLENCLTAVGADRSRCAASN